jgi:hypothetical protein
MSKFYLLSQLQGKYIVVVDVSLCCHVYTMSSICSILFYVDILKLELLKSDNTHRSGIKHIDAILLSTMIVNLDFQQTLLHVQKILILSPSHLG